MKGSRIGGRRAAAAGAADSWGSGGLVSLVFFVLSYCCFKFVLTLGGFLISYFLCISYFFFNIFTCLFFGCVQFCFLQSSLSLAVGVAAAAGPRRELHRWRRFRLHTVRIRVPGTGDRLIYGIRSCSSLG